GAHARTSPHRRALGSDHRGKSPHGFRQVLLISKQILRGAPSGAHFVRACRTFGPRLRRGSAFFWVSPLFPPAARLRRLPGANPMASSPPLEKPALRVKMVPIPWASLSH